MKTIRLKKPDGSGVTVLSNRFIDYYMPRANGEFVKIYLYLLRIARWAEGISVSSIADTFDHTEKDVLRALAYWEKQGLLVLERDGRGEIAQLAFAQPEEDGPPALEAEAASGGAFAPGSSGERGGSLETAGFSKPEGSLEAAGFAKPEGSLETADGKPAASQEPGAFRPPKKEPLTPDRTAELQKQEDIEQLLFAAAQYIGRPLNPSEISNILYYYDSLHFSAELIEYLVEYCVSKGNKSSHYMEAVALGWASQGISTVQEAKQNTNLYNKKYYSVLNAYGIKNRGPAPSEREYMDRWLDEYGFHIAIIAEACNRTVAQTHEASFPYTDKILKEWKKKGVRHLEDILTLDTDRARKKKEHASKNASSNRFNNFHQRDYDFEQLEKQLLNS